MKIVFITSNSLRHKYLACKLKNQKKINLKKVYFEDNLSARLKHYKNTRVKKHFEERDIYEKSFFQNFVNLNINSIKKISQKLLNINDISIIRKIKKIRPDFIICFGTSLLNENFIKEFNNKIINIHLGLSPYYKGVATNFFPILNKQPEYIGGSLIFADKSVDGGEIIHQKQGKILPNDNIHTVGFRLLTDLIEDLIFIICNKKKYLDIRKRLVRKKIKFKDKGKVYYRKDFNYTKIFKAKTHIDKGLFRNYKEKKIKLIKLF